MTDATTDVAVAVANSEIGKGAFFSYLNLLLINVTGIVLTPFIIRSLGPSQYGLYTLIGVVSSYLTLLDFGLGKTITRYVAHYRARNEKECEGKFFATIIRLYGILMLVLLLTGYLLYQQTDHLWGAQFTTTELNDMRRLVVLVAAAHVITVPGNALTAACNGYGLFAFPRGIQVVRYIVRALGIVALLLLGEKAFGLIALDVGLNIAVVVATFIYLRKQLPSCKELIQTTPAPRRPILQYSLWIALYAVTNAFRWHSGQLIAGMTCDTFSVGLIGIGILLGCIYSYFAETFNHMMLPRASRILHRKATPDEITGDMIRVGRIVALPQMFILGGFVIFGETFVTLWAGEAYQEAYEMAVVIMAAWTINLTQDYGNSLLEANGTIRTLAVINFITIFTGMIAAYHVAPHWGVMGIVYTLTGGTIVATIACNIYYRMKLGLKTGRYFRAVFLRLTAITTLLVVSLLTVWQRLANTHSWLWLIAGCIVYAILFIALVYRCMLTDKEKEELRKLCLQR